MTSLRCIVAQFNCLFSQIAECIRPLDCSAVSPLDRWREPHLMNGYQPPFRTKLVLAGACRYVNSLNKVPRELRFTARVLICVNALFCETGMIPRPSRSFVDFVNDIAWGLGQALSFTLLFGGIAAILRLLIGSKYAPGVTLFGLLLTYFAWASGRNSPWDIASAYASSCWICSRGSTVGDVLRLRDPPTI